jgi:hypothetical protein
MFLKTLVGIDMHVTFTSALLQLVPSIFCGKYHALPSTGHTTIPAVPSLSAYHLLPHKLQSGFREGFASAECTADRSLNWQLF